ncbi:MAG: hypothetical protein ACEQSU_10115, partial [Microgenomates group bacterium]
RVNNLHTAQRAKMRPSQDDSANAQVDYHRTQLNQKRARRPRPKKNSNTTADIVYCVDKT